MRREGEETVNEVSDLSDRIFLVAIVLMGFGGKKKVVIGKVRPVSSTAQVDLSPQITGSTGWGGPQSGLTGRVVTAVGLSVS